MLLPGGQYLYEATRLTNYPLQLPHMDIRDTLIVSDTFLSMLTDLHARHQKVALLADAGGITRWEGYLTAILEGEDKPKSTLVLDNGATLTVDQVIAVNGIFRSDYSEC